jgi:hypothetical protein
VTRDGLLEQFVRTNPYVCCYYTLLRVDRYLLQHHFLTFGDSASLRCARADETLSMVVRWHHQELAGSQPSCMIDITVKHLECARRGKIVHGHDKDISNDLIEDGSTYE